jgi:Fe-S cluster assembly iron-binding protein IscA
VLADAAAASLCHRVQVAPEIDLNSSGPPGVAEAVDAECPPAAVAGTNESRSKPDEASEGTTQVLELTDAAITKAHQLLSAEEAGLALRVAVQLEGCTGLRSELSFTDEYKHLVACELARLRGEPYSEADGADATAERVLLEDNQDTLAWFGEVPVLVDVESLPHLRGSAIHYLETLQKSGFLVDIPEAAGSCACGDRSTNADPPEHSRLRRPVHGSSQRARGPD